jgi:hypothetical protein
MKILQATKVPTTIPSPFLSLSLIIHNISILQDFDPCFNYCFLPNEIMDLFSHRSDEPQVTIRIPPNLYDDPTWMGVGLCVLFSVRERCPIAGNLTCRLETDIGSLENLHMYCLTKEDLMLLVQGGLFGRLIYHVGRFQTG